MIGVLLSGVHQLAVRWNTVNDATSSAMAGTTCTPLEDVPITATRLPVKSTGRRWPPSGVEGLAPEFVAPGNRGVYGTERTPVAAIT